MDHAGRDTQTNSVGVMYVCVCACIHACTYAGKIYFARPCWENEKRLPAWLANFTTALSQKTPHNYCQGLSNVPVPDNKNVGFYFPLVFADETNNLLTCSSDADDKLGPARTPSNASHLQIKLRALRHISPNSNMNAESACSQAAACS